MQKATILLVEDDEALLDGMSDTLEMVGYRTIKAANGRKGLEVLAQAHPDLIISDIMMPEMDGYAFHQAVSSNEETSTIPFVFLTAKSDQADVRKGLRIGVDAYLTKPFDLEELLLHVQNKLDRFASIRKEALSQLDLLQHQILTMFSHELRTPLTYIQGYAELLADRQGTASPAEMELFLTGLRSGAGRLSRLVDDLLLLVQVDSGRLAAEFGRFATVQPYLERTIGASVERFNHLATEKGLEIRLQMPESLPPVRIVEEHLMRAIGNLVDNAIKFTPVDGGAITVRAFVRGDAVCIEVEDQGMGIPAKELPHLFERFRQINREKLEQPGVGVGLSIAQAVVQVQGGVILVESKVGQGSTFTIQLPLVPVRLAEDDDGGID